MRRRTVQDWTLDLGTRQEWLVHLESEGWVPEYSAGVRVRINTRDVVRYTLIQAAEAEVHVAAGHRSST